MALRKKHVTMIARILFKVREKATEEYTESPEKLAIAYEAIDTVGLLMAVFLENELTNFDSEKFLTRFGYEKGLVS